MIVEGKLKAKAARTMKKKKKVASGFFGFPVIVIYLRRFSGLWTQSKFCYTTLYPFCCAIMMNIIISA